MELTKESILWKTLYGIKIYAYVLRQYYPEETVLSMAGKDCKPAKNPFNQDRPTLKIQIENQEARHYDLDEAISQGNAFDFASLHFGLSNQDLLEKLNECLYLHIGKKSAYSGKEEKSIAQAPAAIIPSPGPTFSYFKAPVTNTNPAGSVTLKQVYSAVKGARFRKATTELRGITDTKAAKRFKATHFDYVTFSGTFSYRNESSLLAHSGLLVVDLDHLVDVGDMKSKLLQDEYFETELLFISPSGDGLKWVISIDVATHSHGVNFNAVSNYIAQTYHARMDPSGRDVSRACFLAYDPEAFLNPKYR